MLSNGQVGNVTVVTSSNGGLSAEHWSERLLEAIVYVAKDSDSIIKQQALDFKADIHRAILHYMNEAVKSERTTILNLLDQHGEGQAAAVLRRL